MIQVSPRIIKNDDNCPEDLLRSINNCLEQTLAYSHHHQLDKLTQMEKLRVLQKVIRQNLTAVAETFDCDLDCWITEVGGINSYFVVIHFSQYVDFIRSPTGRLSIRLLVTNKVTTLKETCIETVGPNMRRLQESEIRKLELELPSELVEQLREYKMKDEQFYHTEA